MQPIPAVVLQHTEECSILCMVRSVLVNAPHPRLGHLRRLDERLAAHLDGLAVSGEFGWNLCEASLATPGPGEVFTATVRAIEDGNMERLGKLLAMAQPIPASRHGILSALNWVSARWLQRPVGIMCDASDAFQRLAALEACRLHQVDPGTALAEALTTDNMQLRATALRVAGECARRDLLDACLPALSGNDPDCQFRAACSCTLLGDRNASTHTLHSIAARPGPHQTAALNLLLKQLDPTHAAPILKPLSEDDENRRLLIQGTGIAGDPRYIPWLIAQMEDLKLARLAGESFSMITGLDLAWLDLERKPPEDIEFGPNDDPDDDDVAMDEDDGLPWPDQAKIHQWWQANASRFSPGQRYFMGAPPSWPHCLQVLRDGYQRQRLAAAQYLCLLRPGTMLFNCTAPAWRQQRWLDRMR